jgi:hypothetical protein
MMGLRSLVILLGGLRLVVGQEEFFHWSSPYSEDHRIQRRVDGYHPEFGSCGSGKTCADACGSGWEGCEANTTLSLFCYNKPAGQSCCGNGSGRE